MSNLEKLPPLDSATEAAFGLELRGLEEGNTASQQFLLEAEREGRNAFIGGQVERSPLGRVAGYVLGKTFDIAGIIVDKVTQGRERPIL